ncbi:MAG: hypothetical protein ACR2N9_01370 [Acidimicrobiia bacterium]
MRTHSTRRALILVITLLAAFALIAGAAPTAVAAPPSDAGGGRGGGGGGGGGGSDRVGLYSDLVFIYRDTSGVPILNAGGCVQPYSLDKPSGGSALNIGGEIVNFDEEIVDDGLDKDWKVVNGDGASVWLVPLWADVLDVYPSVDLEQLGFEACDIVAEYAAFAHEVPLSRLNVGRAPIRVLHQQYSEVTAMLLGSEIGLDPAGRLTADGVAIDSSPMNQSVYYELLTNGQLVAKDKTGKVILPEIVFPLPGGFTRLEIAAMALGVAADKTTPISIDTVAYLNRIYGITDFGPPEEFHNFGGFAYDRATTYNGCLEVWAFNGDGVPVIEAGTVVDLVFGGANAGGANIDGFAQWADDARRVNLYLHDAAGVVAADNLGSTAVCDSPDATEVPASTQPLLDLLPDDDVASMTSSVVVVVDKGRKGKGRVR